MSTGLERCSDLSRAAGEVLAGTASQLHGWLLVEQPGPWGRDAPAANRLPPDVAAHLRDVAQQARLRLLLIRRPGRDANPPTRHVYVARPLPGRGQLVAGLVAAPHDLLRLDAAALGTRRDAPLPASAGTLGLSPIDAPSSLLLVCTHGSHDLCCAVYGRPVANTLAHEPDVWETSHIGGDRFAPNAVAVPSGVYYGRVPVDRAGEVLHAARHDRIVPDLYRGRVVHSFADQAGEAFARAALDAWGVGDVHVVRAHPHPAAAGEVARVLRATAFADALPPVLVRGTRAQARQLTCGGEPGLPWRFDARWAPELDVPPAQWVTEPATAADTWPVRRAALRAGRPDANVAARGDGDPATSHYVVRAGSGEVAGAVTCVTEPCPAFPTEPARRVAMLAVAPVWQQAGAGAALMAAAVADARAGGAHLLWAKARDTALVFYERSGFRAYGDGFTGAMEVPHHVVVRRLVG